MSDVQVTCVGVVTLDVIAVVDSFPQVEGRMEAQDVMVTGGGPAANAAVVLARQDVPTAFVGLVGDDRAGLQTVELLAAEGVDTSGTQVVSGARTQTSCVIVETSSMSRSIITTPVAPLQCLSGRARDLIGSSQWLHVDHRGYEVVRGLLPELHTRPLLSLDSGNATIPNLDLSVVDLYVPTVTSLLAGSGTGDVDRAARDALSAGCHAVVATDGRRGARAWWDGEGAGFGGHGAAGSATAPAHVDGVDVVSTLGAGDVFHGALVSALYRKCTWEQALGWANITAGLSTQGRDGREAVPDASSVSALLKP